MQFAYHLIDDMPPLAWVAICDPVAGRIEVMHGRFVECRADFFVEGAWSGDYPAGRIADADTVFGSGAARQDGAAVFVACTATTDSLYYRSGPAGAVVANSLPLLLGWLDDELDPDFAGYARINMSILSGIRHYAADIPSRKGGVRRLLHHNLRFDRDGLRLQEKPLPPPFASYDEYRDFMLDRIGTLFANARHAERRRPMQVFSTQSKGYDSTAVNALAARYGIDKVFTSRKSKEKGSFYLGDGHDQPSDDGTPVCAALGLECVAIDRLGFRNGLDDEELYWAGLDNNQDLNLHEIQSHVEAPTLLLTGNLGEIWYTKEAVGEARLPTFNDELIRWDQAGHGLAEVRLARGMVQVAVPFIGARHRASLLAITEDPSMDAYRLGGDYDRPIPRRIAEEAGVARELFGQIKLASIVHLPTPNLPVTPALREAFLRHLRRRGLLGRLGAAMIPIVQRLNNWIYWQRPGRFFSNRRRYPILWHAGYAWARLTGRPLRIQPVWGWLDSCLYAFCVNRVAGRYRDVCTAAGQVPPGRDVGPETAGATIWK